jgi:hypothetical protein
MSIEPGTIHPIPLVTIRKLATALYWIGIPAQRGKTETCAKAKSRLALIEAAVEEALEPEWTQTPAPATPG